LDKTYLNIIKPAVEKSDLECIRGDEIQDSGLIDKNMYALLLQADLVIADITTYNPNAIYELGVRHAVRPFSTIIIKEKHDSIPFDLNHNKIFHYEHMGDDIGASKESTQNISLAAEPGEVDPIPVDVKGGRSEPELDTLENILSAFNQRFGDIEWSDKDKVRQILTKQLPDEMKANKDIMDAIQHSDKQNAKISSDRKLEELMQQYLFSQTEIFKKFTTDKDFQRRYKEYMFDLLVNSRNQSRINP